MVTINSVQARQILDSRGNPTVECDVTLSDGAFGRGAVPSGASTGSFEAFELRDGLESYGGKGVLKAVGNIHEKIAPLLKSVDPFDQVKIDQIMCDADGTENKSRLGANAILAVSFAVAKACARSSGIALHDYIAQLANNQNQRLPIPMVNIINGGQHANFATEIQEYMIVPLNAKSIKSAIETSAGVFHALGEIIKSHNLATTVGDEGGYAPQLAGGNTAPLDLILQSVGAVKHQIDGDVAIALDVAASEFYVDGSYQLKSEDRRLLPGEMIEYLVELARQYPIISIEDGLAEDSWADWAELTKQIGDKLSIVGDDLLVTNVKRLHQAIKSRAGNSILIKPNQIGTLTETIDAVMVAHKSGWKTIMSHRSGETEDVTIAHLAVGLGCHAIKTGSMSRSERVAKYNELIRIEETKPDLKIATWESINIGGGV